VLAVIGLIEIAVMIYCIVNRISCSSSFNMFAVIAGMLLMRGGLKTGMRRVNPFRSGVLVAPDRRSVFHQGGPFFVDPLLN
jgi:hypothetical protein